MSRYRYRTRKPLAVRFWAKVTKGDGCWLWQAARDSKGYGVIGVGGKGEGIARAHRVSYELAHDVKLDKGVGVLHLCDTPACVRPDHLVLGDQTENMRQAKERGRTSNAPKHGPDHWNAKLSDEDVISIRSRRRAGELLRTIAEDFHVSEAQVSRIALGRSRITFSEQLSSVR